MTTTITINELLTQEPARVRTWLDQVRAGQVVVPGGFNWLGLAEAAGSLARQAPANGLPEAALAWASVATDVYERLAATAQPYGRNSLECSAMMVRAAMIERFGARPGHPILDPAIIEQWFVDRLPMSRDEAVSLFKDSRDRFLQLRGVKNRLNVVQVLMADGFWRDNTTLRQWMDIRDSLP